MTSPSLVVYVTESCPFCEEFLKTQAPLLFAWLVESTISYESIEAPVDLLRELDIKSVPCIVYNKTIIDPQMVRFTAKNIIQVIQTISSPKAPTFSSMLTTAD